jgi:hypothetical protein
MAELFKKPSLQATVSPAGWRSIKVATQQAPVSPLIDLAKTLNVAGQAAQTYAGLQAFEYKQGVKEGEIAAASADLDEAIEGLDTAGEQLVEQGLMPRSQLFGYQKGFRKHIGQREAKSSFYTGLQGRLKEVEMNPENGNYDIIDQIIQQEETNSLERLRQTGGSELALQGFAEFSSEIKDRFKIQATQNRDKAIQKFNNNMYIEDFNQEFGDRLTDATTPEDIATLQSDIKITMDSMTAEGKIPRSEVVEIFFNGFMVPNVNNLLVGPSPQPDKAERVLDALLDIDLTGRGGRLGNINREGAQIRSKAVELRSRIESARDKIEDDKEEISDDILTKWTLASQGVTAGLTDDEKFNNASNTSVVDILVDAGYSIDESVTYATELIQNQDTTRLQRLLFAGYSLDDAKSEAFSDASRRFLTVAKQRRELELLSVSNEDRRRIADDFAQKKNDNPDYTAAKHVQTVGVKDRDVIQELNKIDQNIDDQFWYIRGPAKNIATEKRSAFEDSLQSELNNLYIDEATGKFQRGFTKAIVDNKYNATWQDYMERYDELRKEASIKISKKTTNLDERIEDINDEEKRIQSQIIDAWKAYQTFEKQYEQEKRRLGQPPETSEELLDEIVSAEDDLEALDSVYDKMRRGGATEVPSIPTRPYAPFVPAKVGPVIRFGEDIGTYAGDSLGAVADERAKALSVADRYESKLSNPNELITDFGDKAPNKYSEVIYDIRRRYGYDRFEDVPDLNEKIHDVEYRFDPRVTPFVRTLTTLAEYDKALVSEFSRFENTPVEQRNVEEYPILNLMQKKFGIPPQVGTVSEFMRMQKDQFRRKR